jgi:hypothetical protein
MFHSTFSDGSPDFTSPHRKGFRFADTDDADRLAADEAYEQMRTRLADAYKHRQQHGGDVRKSSATGAAPTRAPTLDALQQAAEKAYEDRNARMQNAWKHRDGA